MNTSNLALVPAASTFSERPALRSVASTRMRAVIATGYGPTDVLELTELDRPTPKAGELVIKVVAANVSAADSMMRRGDPAFARLFLGLKKPRHAVPGTCFAGVVEAIGDDVTLFHSGDAVFGLSGVSFGAHAEFVCVPEDSVVLHKPEHLSFEDASTLCDGPTTSLNFLKRMAQVGPGQKVLINGAAGSLGTAAVQIARAFGAEVTGVCSAANHELVKSLGADHVIDYRDTDFTRTGAKYDVIYDTVGKSSFSRCKAALTARGQYLSPVLGLRLLFAMIWTSIFSSGQRAKFDATGLRPAPEMRDFLDELTGMTASGALRVVTERVYRLEQIGDAHARVDSGHKVGNLVLRIGDAR